MYVHKNARSKQTRYKILFYVYFVFKRLIVFINGHCYIPSSICDSLIISHAKQVLERFEFQRGHIADQCEGGRSPSNYG